MFSFDCLRGRLHLPSRGLDKSVKDILRCSDGNGYLRLLETVSTQVVCLLDFSLLTFDALRFSGDNGQGADMPAMEPFRAMLPAAATMEKHRMK
jgi:hypothetical protein